MPKSEVDKLRHEREKIKRKSLVGRSSHDIVASFSHHRIVDVEKLHFQEHHATYGSWQNEKIFTVRTEACENVVEIGKEVSNLDEGYDYAIAIVNRETGEMTFREVRFYAFEAVHSLHIPELIGKKKRSSPDYNACHDIKAEDFARKRVDLTTHFGSSKKIKIQEASIRRQINDETLDAMRKTAFASTTVLAEVEDIKKEQISMVDNARSSVLPHPHSAELPHNIYPISIFLSDDEIRSLSDCALEYLSSSKKQLSESGFPEPVLKMLTDSGRKDPSLAVPFTLLGCMTFLSSLFSSKSVLKRQFNKTPFPEPFVQKVMGDFINAQIDRGANGKMSERLSVSSHEKDRLVAHLLALALTLSSDCSLPITQWQIALKKSNRFVEKILVGLGCDIIQCNVEEAARTESLRAARLLRPPSKECGAKKTRRKK
ncbi:A49-like RNA polymerase I associated factor [Dictyocaulus viviparus]|uniref:A49-like RNA polymerase I associated factor n=1 Tax=Dictyocaulus viviparus TaxID=29172 RepID=A0A0D8XG62_DICVI|nr:A49-like RNA polymerase I associated factor [Dictyocaulus viviparus]